MANEDKGMKLIDIVEKLVGPVDPLGETNVDSERFENLKVLCKLADDILVVIARVEFENKDRHQFSMKQASEYAGKALSRMGIKE